MGVQYMAENAGKVLMIYQLFDAWHLSSAIVWHNNGHDTYT